jgi:signal transduction histidine kinase
MDTTDVASKPRHRRIGWTWLLMPRPFSLISSAFYVSVFLAFLFDYHNGLYNQCGCQDGSLRLLLVISAIALLFVLDRVEYWLYGEETPMRAAVVLFATRVLLYEVIAWADYAYYSPLLAIYLALLGYWYFGSFVAYGLAFLVIVDFALHHIVTDPMWLTSSSDIQFDILFVLALLFTLTIVHVLIREKTGRTQTEQVLIELEEAHQQLGDAHQQLRSYAEQVEELATTKERNRLAREIHDSLGHYLTIINVQLEKALVFRERDVDESYQAVETAKRLAHEALQEVRRSVSALRSLEDGFAFTPAISDLVERIQSRQLSVALKIVGSEKGYSQQALLTLFRAAQEGLTNIEKHASASSAELEIELEDAFARLRLRDNGQGFDLAALAALQPGRQGSYGLQGLRERLEQVGGTLEISSSQEEGTYLSANVPKVSVESNGTRRIDLARGTREGVSA